MALAELEKRLVPTRPFDDQKPGTAGLRKKVEIFRQPDYLENFVQSVFNAAGGFEGSTIVAGGDGRFYNREALQILAGIAAANGVERLIVGTDGLLSTPAASHLIRHREADGGFLLTASHNPGGPDGDFGIKFNTANGGQASEGMTDRLYETTRKIDSYSIADLEELDLSRIGERAYGPLVVEVVDPVSDYAALMQTLFDFDRIRDLFKTGFSMCFDAMNAVTGPYAKDILEDMLGAPEGTVINGRPLPDFGGLHPDPNPVDAQSIVDLMNSQSGPDFGAASDGDGDRNMILGRGLVVSPGDSLAVMAANATLVPGYRDGLAGVARSMPTSRAVDRVAQRLGINCYETPTGWRFFCNLLESGKIDLCGEESFGTSSSHVREKDGLWAVLFWLDLVAATGTSVTELIQRHCHYRDPIDGSESRDQGIRVFFADDSRIIYRLSGTGTSGATLRVYLERYLADAGAQSRSAWEATERLASISRELARIKEIAGMESPSGVV
jgi:phosphoglucomutase